MANRIQIRRLAWLALLLSIAFAGLGYRLVDLQVLRHEELNAKAQQKIQQEVLLEPRRGDILDSKGNILATSITVKTICADPLFMANRQAEVARALAPLLQENEAKLCERLQPRVRQNPQGQTQTNLYVVLKRKVPVETWEQIQAVMKNLSFGLDEGKLPRADREAYQCLRQKAIFAEDDHMRVYPNQALAAHVLGCVATEEREVNDRTVLETVGIDGIEMTMNAKLAGVRGWRLTETDRHRREVVARREQDVEPRDGLDVVLTIDSVIQNIAESALAEVMEKHSPISASAIVVRPRTGEILALATLPNYDPNTRLAPLEARRNRVITDLAEPGSTFKIVVVSGALNCGAVHLTDSFDCEHGHFYFANRTLHDHESYGVLSVENIVTKSSNIGAAKVGIALGPDRLYEYIKAFGFGERTGIPLPGEVNGQRYVPNVTNWTKVSIAQIPMGHGVSVTRLQMAMAMCALANKGMLMRPMLIQRLEDRDHNIVAQYSPQRVRPVISEPTAKLMVQALKTVVTTNGTAAKAALDHYTVAGKTGTAQKVENGFYVNKFFSSFIGFFPADNPELCISVTLDEPKGGHYGGQIAAPVFKQIAERAANYLSLPPEDNEPPSVPDTIAAPVDTTPFKAAARARSENNQ
jgi:cell division protein FtsI/penicillin-binding protein 2